MAVIRKDYYFILEVTKNANQEEIKCAYLNKVRQYHPDRNPGNQEANEKFKSISEAYSVLQNPKKRSLYDRGLDVNMYDDDFVQYKDQQSHFSRFTQDFKDIFEDFFQSNSTTKSTFQDVEHNISLTIKDVILGKNLELDIPYLSTCQTCKGSKTQSSQGQKTCRYCNGQGVITQTTFIIVTSHSCHYCGGSGQVITDPCITCGGRGVTKKHKTLKINIPPGIQDENIIKINNVDQERDSNIRHLYLRIRIKPDNKFFIKNHALHSIQEVSMLRLMLGGTIKINTPVPNENVTVQIKPGTNPNEIITIKNYGIAKASSRNFSKSITRESLHVIIKPIIPSFLTTKHLLLLQNIQDDLDASSR